jgi:hypothetical protein
MLVFYLFIVLLTVGDMFERWASVNENVWVYTMIRKRKKKHTSQNGRGDT